MEQPIPEAVLVSFFVVYGLRFLAKNVIVYVGHTGRARDDRQAEHFNLASGARRVITAFAQPRFQPTVDHFALEELWSGECTLAEACAIEQLFIDKHDTRVHPRPSNGITADIDLFQDAEPLQLNVVRACTDQARVDAVEPRVRRDTALVVVRKPSVSASIANHLSELMLVANETAESTACARIQRHLFDLAAMSPSAPVDGTRIHQMLNDVFRAWHHDDGVDLREILMAKLQWYHVDKRARGYTKPAMLVHAEMATLDAALGIVRVSGSPMSSQTDAVFRTADEYTSSLIKQALSHRVRCRGEVIPLSVRRASLNQRFSLEAPARRCARRIVASTSSPQKLVERMKLLSVPFMWNGISGDKRDFSKHVAKLLLSDHGIALKPPVRGSQFVPGSGTGQPHLPDTTFVGWNSYQSAAAAAAGADEAGSSGASNEREEHEPSASDPASKKRLVDAVADPSSKKKKKAKRPPPTKGHASSDDDMLDED